MSITNDELNSFHQFALAVIQEQGKDLTLESLVSQWRNSQERRETNEAISQSLAEFESGQGRPVKEFLDEMKTKHDFSPEA